MATIKQITDTEGTTHDIGCKWENITDKPEIKDINVKSDPTTSTYYLCGSTTSESTTGTLVKKPNVYVNTNDELVAHAFIGNRVETPTLHLTNGGSSGGKIVFGDTIEDDVEIHDGHYACIEEMEDNVLDFKATAFRFQNEGSFFQFTGGPIIIDEDFPIEGNITGTASYADGAGHADEANHANEADYAGTANCLADKSKGSTIQPVYINTSGRPVACSYSLSKSVPSDAVFTDTKNTVGITTTANKIYLVGATSTSTTTGASANSYTNASVYATNGALTATTFVVAGTKATTSSRITSDASYNLYFTVGGKTPLVMADDNSSNIFVAPGSSYSNRYSLGTSNRLWKDVYATTFYGNLSGTASSAYTAEAAGKAEADSDGNTIKTTYLKLSGGTMTGSIVTPGDDTMGIYPAKNNYGFVGSSTNKFYKMYASTFYGALSGNATTATTATTATNVKVTYIDGQTSVSTNISYYPVFVNGAGDSKILYDTAKIVFVPSTGTVSASGGFYETSDERLKEIIKPVDIDLNKIKKLRKIYFDWKDEPNHKHQIGMIAQDVRELYPEIVSESEEGQLSLAYDKLSVIALGAIDILHNENIELKNRIEKLENFVNQLSEKINN